jgi:hypothetical protein
VICSDLRVHERKSWITFPANTPFHSRVEALLLVWYIYDMINDNTILTIYTSNTLLYGRTSYIAL